MLKLEITPARKTHPRDLEIAKKIIERLSIEKGKPVSQDLTPKIDLHADLFDN
jgi:hypothetical protein